MIVTAETSVRRGRHRRPRPRKLLFAAGGLALAAGVLSLVRMTPESGVGAAGTAEADPRQDPGSDRPGHAVAAVDAVPRVSPSATSVMGGASATPTAHLVALQTPTTPPDPAAAPGTTTIPVTPNSPSPTTSSQPPATTAPAPQPTPTPGRTTPPPTPRRSDTHDPGLCVPVIGLCTNPLAAP
ncbi:hypothetical protein GCM10022403_072980 [Streptomyces coacervatus]|uniref:Uncharacterized protein n=1 Tax=Streptomyces coacervatus TaxID=647381 RepID=A0ABP7IWV6_9ACTN|nr:hypothetical protein [Streptomyces coacervatus]MDF2270260.1 hypothetical protein [Streptomyces coacervatus]